MARVTPIFSSFASGELTPRLDGRVDLQEIYFRGCRTLENDRQEVEYLNSALLKMEDRLESH